MRSINTALEQRSRVFDHTNLGRLISIASGVKAEACVTGANPLRFNAGDLAFYHLHDEVADVSDSVSSE
jgi:hypothetical protein